MQDREIFNNQNCCIIIQGPSIHVDEIKKTMNGQNIIFSTWEGDEDKYIKTDNVIFNKKPQTNGIGNLFYQQETTINGLLKAKNLKFEKALKLRSDFIVYDINKLLLILTSKLNFFFWHDYDGGYICDYLMAGNIDLMIELWSINKNSNYEFAEKMILENFLKMNLKKEEIYFFLKDINTENDIYWTKYKKYLSSYNREESALNYIK